MSYNKEPKNMLRISEIEYAKSICNYLIGIPEQRQPLIGNGKENAHYVLQMFPVAYFNHINLGFAFRITYDNKVVYYKYGSAENWSKLEDTFINKVQGLVFKSLE
jgi:hypothetical protein